MENDDDGCDLVKLAEFASEEEFLVVRGLLESAGIECFCPDFYYRKGNIVAQVRKQDLADARALLKAPEVVETKAGEA